MRRQVVPLVQLAVVGVAQQDEVVEIGRAAVGPVPDVVGLAARRSSPAAPDDTVPVALRVLNGDRTVTPEARERVLGPADQSVGATGGERQRVSGGAVEPVRPGLCVEGEEQCRAVLEVEAAVEHHPDAVQLPREQPAPRVRPSRNLAPELRVDRLRVLAQLLAHHGRLGDPDERGDRGLRLGDERGIEPCGAVSRGLQVLQRRLSRDDLLGDLAEVVAGAHREPDRGPGGEHFLSTSAGGWPVRVERHGRVSDTPRRTTRT